MHAHSLPFAPAPQPAPTCPLPEQLNRLRFLAAGCRAARRMDLFQACAMLNSDAESAVQAYATAALRTLGQALDRQPQIRSPGAEPSFDELWLMRLIERSQAGDSDSLAFLLMRRVPVAKRHAFLHLINGLARRLPEL